MWPDNPVDNFLNKITMYRLVLYYLCALVAAGFVASFFGVVPFAPQNLAFSVIVLVGACWGFNALFARFFSAQANIESSYITALILALIITPPDFTPDGVAFLLFASLFAMASKYVLAWGYKHVFNPAAIAVVLTAYVFGWYASWWVGGNNYLLPFVLVGGLLAVRKIQRFDLALTFVACALLSIFVTGGSDIVSSIGKSLLHTSIFFFAFVMLTEPATTPPTRVLRVMYGALAGLLFSPALHVGAIFSTPELVLVISNIFSFAVSPKVKAQLRLREKREIGTGIWEFVFSKPAALAFQPGQFMEWTLAHARADTRGNRRYFTIASAPTESDVRLGVRIEPEVRSSTFKKQLLSLAPGQSIGAGQLAGDFTLPADPGRKLALVAGGIGITPMRSMLKALADRGERRDIVLLYSSKSRAEVAYADVLEGAAQKSGTKVVYVITGENGQPDSPRERFGRIDEDMIRREAPDWRERVFYISGTHEMTESLKAALRRLGVPRSSIKVDFFPGF